MRNIRLYIGGRRADLDSSVNIPFTYQTTDAEMPTAVRNSYSKTVTLQGTETNRRLFGGLWHLDSLVRDPAAPAPPRYEAIDTESDAEFISRATPVLATGDALKVTKVLGDTVVWNQLIWIPSTVSGTGRNVTVTNNGDGSYTLNGIADSTGWINWGFRWSGFSITQGHKYYIALKRGGTVSGIIFTSTNIGNIDSGASSAVVAATASGDPYMAFRVTSGTNLDNYKVYPQLIDLTLMFGSGNEPTAAQFEALYPLDYYDYNAGQLVSNGASALETRDAGNGVIGSFPLDVIDLVPDALPTVRLNQLVQNGDFSDGTNNWVRQNTGFNYATSGGVMTLTKSTVSNQIMMVRQSVNFASGRKYVIFFDIRVTSSQTGNLRTGYIGSPTAWFYTFNVDVSAFSAWRRQSYILTGGGQTDVFLGGYNVGSWSFDVGDKVELRNIRIIDLTEMYGSGNEPTSTAEIEELIGTAYIPYNTGQDIANKIFPVGLKSAGTAYDEASGSSATKRIGVVDLGTLSWSYSSGKIFFYAALPGAKADGGSMCAKYASGIDGGTFYADTSKDKVVGITFTNISSAERVYVRDSAYTDATTFKASVSGVFLYYELATPVNYTLAAPLSDEPVPSDPSGYQIRIPEDTAGGVLAPFRADFEYGRMVYPPEDTAIYFNPMKRVDFLLYVDEMIVERGYCQLVAINRRGRDYTFSVSLYGGLGEFFYNLQTGSDGESRSLADLDWGEDLSFRINAGQVQQNWDDILGGTLPTVAFVPMHNGVPKSIDGDKMLVKGGGVPASITDGGNTYTYKDGYLLASCERKYTEWETHDLRSYLQRPAIRLKSFINACILPANNGGWSVDLDGGFFANTNPYYENSYILLPQLNVEEESEDVCDDGTLAGQTQLMANLNYTFDLTPSSGCLSLVGDYVDMSSYASNAYLTASVPVQTKITGLASQGDLYMASRMVHTTYLYSFCYQLVAYDDDGNVLGTSPRYVFCTKNHHDEVPASVLNKPTALESTTDAQIEGCFKYQNGSYVFVQDTTNADTFLLQIDKIQRPSSTQHRVKIVGIMQRFVGHADFNTSRKGSLSSYVVIDAATQFQMNFLGVSGNSLKLSQPTQYASNSLVTQEALLNSLDKTPLELLLSYTKSFGLMWVQDNQEKKVKLLQRTSYYTGAIRDIHNRIDYSRGLKVTPVSAESNIYVLKNEYPETDLSKAYESDYGRTYGEVRLSIGYDFGKEKIETMQKVELQGFVDGALSGSGYWEYSNILGELPSAIAEGMKVTYYYDNGGTTDTKDVDYNLFNVTAVTKYNSPALGVACLNDDGEEKGVDVAPALVFVAGGQVDGTYHLSDDVTAMATLNGSPCWIYDESRAVARIPRFCRVATFSGETYSLDFGTPRMTYYIPEVGLAPEQAVYSRYWERYLTDLLSRDTKKVECYVVFPPHLDMREEMRKFYLFDRSLWVLNKITDYDPTKSETVKCEFIRVIAKDSYLTY